MWMPLISVKTKTWNYYPDNELNKIKEIKLPINTFNPYTGWCQIHDGILFFVDKITDQEISEDLEVHIFHPVMIKND